MGSTQQWCQKSKDEEKSTDIYICKLAKIHFLPIKLKPYTKTSVGNPVGLLAVAYY